MASDTAHAEGTAVERGSLLRLPELKSQSSSLTMFMVFGASIPIRTEFGPIRTTVMAMSSPIRIRSLVFRESTNIFLSLLNDGKRSLLCGAASALAGNPQFLPKP
jgi:hypothetical protein